MQQNRHAYYNGAPERSADLPLASLLSYLLRSLTCHGPGYSLNSAPE
jgi:hypothetical protein